MRIRDDAVLAESFLDFFWGYRRKKVDAKWVLVLRYIFCENFIVLLPRYLTFQFPYDGIHKIKEERPKEEEDRTFKWFRSVVNLFCAQLLTWRYENWVSS